MSDEKLSILHFSTADNEGGSGRAAYRIHCGLRELGYRSRMLVGIKVTRDLDVDTVTAGRIAKIADLAADEVTKRMGLQYQIIPSSRRVRRHPWVNDAHIIQLYNTHGGYFSLRMLPWLSRRAPIVWRLSDMWPMTGHCAYAGPCTRWMTGCGNCPDLATYPPINVDLTAWLWRQKRRIYNQCDLTIVAPSSWTESLARQSPLLSGVEVRRIPNGIDTDVFKPRSREMARSLLDLDPTAKAILFVAQELDDNPRKGGAYLMEALRRLAASAKIEVLLVGIGGESWEKAVPFPVRRLGYVTDDRLMSAIYNSADLIVAPSVVENLPNTVLEAMACGVPAVAFDTGGMADAVRHMETGYLVPFGDVEALAVGIGTLLKDDDLRLRLGRASVGLVRTMFSKQTQAQAFAGLYAEILESRHKNSVVNNI
jgi:glycosyltransferase involved in cell wall biosynthesis